MPDTLSSALDEYHEKLNERLEYELRGAWRAGYDYVHIYREPPMESFGLAKGSADDTLTIKQLIQPTGCERPIESDKVIYEYTYDLTAIPDDVIREHLRGSA